MKDTRDARTRAATGQENNVNATRRKLLGALATVPPLAVLAACSGFDPTRPGGGSSPSASSAISVSDFERNRRRRSVRAHVGEENQHDIDGLMDTFAEGAEVSVQGTVVSDRELIRQGHIDGGFSSAPGGLENLRVEPEIEYITDDEIVFEGRLVGTHVRPMNGFPPTSREVAIPYVAFYRFDEEGKLASERLTFNWGVLSPTPPEWPFD